MYPFTGAAKKLPITIFFISLPINLLSFKEEGRGGKCFFTDCGFLPLFSSYSPINSFLFPISYSRISKAISNNKFIRFFSALNMTVMSISN
jgi:hypothetical protein